MPPLVDIAPPVTTGIEEKEVVMYSKEVQTTAWVPVEESSDEEDEEEVNRRVEEEVKARWETLRLEEQQRDREMEAQRLQTENDVPGMNILYGDCS
jgi:hypothetical protein